jgi:hypothetical protein
MPLTLRWSHQAGARHASAFNIGITPGDDCQYPSTTSDTGEQTVKIPPISIARSPVQLLVEQIIGLTFKTNCIPHPNVAGQQQIASQINQATNLPVAAPFGHDQFIDQANALCRQISAQIPLATDPTDLQGLSNAVNASLSVYPGFLGQVSNLIATQPDQPNLAANWLSPMQTDFDAARGLGAQFVQAVRDGDTETANQLLDQISAAPDHRTDVETFLNGYGLTDCATLEAQ